MDGVINLELMNQKDLFTIQTRLENEFLSKSGDMS